MKKASILIIVLFLTGFTMAADSVISPGTPSNVILNSSNSYSVTKQFDGTGSSPDSATHRWEWTQNSTTKYGDTTSFTFTRANDKSNTIKLTIISESDSAESSVTQNLRDEPEIVSVPSDKTIDPDSDETFNVGDYSIENTFNGPLNYSWSLESPDSDDGSGTGESFTHTYSEEGTYNLELNVSDSKGFYNVANQVDITVEDSSGDQDEENNNQDQQEDSTENQEGTKDSVSFEESYYFGTVADGGLVEASFDESPIESVSLGFSEGGSSIEVGSKAGKSIDDLPNGKDEKPEGTAYRYIELSKGNFEDDDVDNVSFEFEVEKDWIDENNILRDSVDLKRYNDGWENLGAEETDEDEQKVYYTAESSGLSVFSITGEEAEASFNVNSVEISPQQVDPGENFTVTVEAENTGNIEGDYDFSFDLAGQSFEETLSLNAGESGTSEFNLEVSENGSYKVEVGGSSASVQVGQVEENDVVEDQEQEETQEEQEGFGLVLPVIGILVLLSLGVLALIVFTGSKDRQLLLERIEEFFTGEENNDDALSSDDYSFTD